MTNRSDDGPGRARDGGNRDEPEAALRRQTDDDPLGTRRRRTTLRVLSARRLLASVRGDADRATVDVDDLVSTVVDRERSQSGATADRAAHRRAVAAALRFEHLPALDEAGVVDHDPEGETVAYRGDPDLESRLHLAE